jgi:uncharacterized protein DUF6496
MKSRKYVRGPNRAPSVIHERPLEQRPTTVTDAASQLPKTRGFTGGLNRPINPDNQPMRAAKGPAKPRRGYGATPSQTPVDSKIGWRGQETAGYDGEKKWIKGAIKHPGALHRQLGVPEGQKIPAGKVAAAAQKGGKLGQRARLAQTLSHMGHDAEPAYDAKSAVSKKIETNMREMKAGDLHSGSKHGPKVTNPKQAIAISYSQVRRGKE